MPILALIVIFAGFDGMTVHGNWTGFFLVLGGLTSAAGVLGLCIFRDSPALRPVQGDTYLRDVLYAFRPANIRANKMIYICFLGMMFSGLAMQLWQPYMISLVEVTLGIDNYILPIGIVVLASAVLSVLAGKAMDRFGKEKFYYPVAILQVLGGLIAYSIKFVGHAMPLLCVGGTCIMAGNLAMAGLFTASSRDYTPAGRAGASQSVKMVIYIMLPMVLASIIDPLIIRAVALEPTAAILAKYPSYAGSYLYPYVRMLCIRVSCLQARFEILREILYQPAPEKASPRGLARGQCVSFLQRGELLAADAVGVPADEVRGDEDEHRAHGRGVWRLPRFAGTRAACAVFLPLGGKSEASMNESQSNSFLAEQPVGALMRKFSLPCILSLLVGALYNIVDQREHDADDEREHDGVADAAVRLLRLPRAEADADIGKAVVCVGFRGLQAHARRVAFFCLWAENRR